MDAVWAGIAKDVVAAGQANCVVRTDHEFNGGFYAWAQDHNPADHAAAFARFVTAFPRQRLHWQVRVVSRHRPRDDEARRRLSG